jgi:hypothetical protein
MAFQSWGDASEQYRIPGEWSSRIETKLLRCLSRILCYIVLGMVVNDFLRHWK